MSFFLFILVIVILFFVLSLRGRVEKLEQIIKSFPAQGSAGLNIQPQAQADEAVEIGVEKAFNEVAQSSAEMTVGTPLLAGPSLSEKFVEWLKEDWMLKLGAMLLLIGFGWLTTYAFLNNWIGPMGRIALGLAAGALFILFGWQRIKNYITQGGIFIVLGSTIILLTVFAAREIYGFFTPLSALVVMFLSTAFVAMTSVRYNNRALALMSLVLAGIAPLLTSAPSPNYAGLFAYLLVVIIGAIWIVAITGRRELTTAALILITFYSLPHLASLTSSDKGVLLIFAYAFAALFFLTNTAGILKLKDKKIVPDLITAGGNGLLLLAWIMFAAQDEWKSLIISAWMIVFSVGAFLIFRITQRREPFYVYAGVGIAMLAAATAAELNGPALIIAYTIESGVIALIAFMVLRDTKITKKISLLLMVPVILSFSSLDSRAWKTSVLHEDFFVLLILGLTFFGLGLFFLRRAKDDEELGKFSAILLIIGSIYAYLLIWLSLHAGLPKYDNSGTMISLVIYTIIGLICYFYGLANGKKSLRLYGGLLVGLVVGRLLLVDVWRMDLAGRIAIFFIVGTLLISTAFLGRKNHKNDILK